MGKHLFNYSVTIEPSLKEIERQVKRQLKKEFS